MRRARIAVLVSGSGTNLQALLDAEAAGTLRSGKVVLVVSSNPGAYALERAKAADIPTFLPDSDNFEDDLVRKLEAEQIDLILLAGFLRILSPAFTVRYPRRILNVHPSLIPAFCGAGFYGLRVHRAALDFGVKVTGATVHFVNEIPDGGEILAQKAVHVAPDDTPETLQRRVMEQCEWQLLPQTAEDVCHRILQEEKL